MRESHEAFLTFSGTFIVSLGLPLSVDGERVRAELAVQPFEHVSLGDVLRLLATNGAAPLKRA